MVGAGQMSRGVVAALRSKGVTGPGRHDPQPDARTCREVAESVGGAASGLDSLAGALAEADSVIVTTSAPDTDPRPRDCLGCALCRVSAGGSRRLWSST